MRQKVTSREQIREAALAIAVREGIDHVSIRKLASACNMAVGSMYNYYPDKDALIAAVAETFWGSCIAEEWALRIFWSSITAFCTAGCPITIKAGFRN